MRNNTATTNNRVEELRELTRQLEEGVTRLFTSGEYENYLRVMSKFHKYSARNAMLIYLQKPNATHVAGYTTWITKFHRHVRRGERSIRIIAPMSFTIQQERPILDTETHLPVLDNNGNQRTEVVDVIIPRYKTISVYDVSQTEGEPLPSIGVNELSGTIENYDDFEEALDNITPIPIVYDIMEGTQGYYDRLERSIVIKDGMSDLHTIKTIINQIAFVKITDPNLSSEPDYEFHEDENLTPKIEAESVAYIVCQHYGLDTSEYTFGHIAAWSSGKELPELQSSLDTIQKTADEIITAIDDYLANIDGDDGDSAEEVL